MLKTSIVYDKDINENITEWQFASRPNFITRHKKISLIKKHNKQNEKKQRGLFIFS